MLSAIIKLMITFPEHSRCINPHRLGRFPLMTLRSSPGIPLYPNGTPWRFGPFPPTHIISVYTTLSSHVTLVYFNPLTSYVGTPVTGQRYVPTQWPHHGSLTCHLHWLYANEWVGLYQPISSTPLPCGEEYEN